MGKMEGRLKPQGTIRRGIVRYWQTDMENLMRIIPDDNVLNTAYTLSWMLFRRVPNRYKYLWSIK